MSRSAIKRSSRALACVMMGIALTLTCLAVAPAGADPGVTPQSAEGYWSFDTAADGSYVNAGTKKSLTLAVSGEGAKVEASDLQPLGSSLVLADRNRDFDVCVAHAVDSQRAYSISLWICAQDSAPEAKTALLQFAGSGRTLLYQRGSGEFVSFVGGNDISLGGDAKRGSWQHLVITKTGDPRNVALYINGVRNGSGGWSQNLPAGMMDLIIGEHKNAADMARFQGKIDELCVFNRALGEQEVKQLYASYGDITIAHELELEVDLAQHLLDGAGVQDAAPYERLSRAIERARTALGGNDLDALRAARAELAAAVEAVHELGAAITVDPTALGRAIDDSLFGINHRYSNHGYGTVNADGSVKDDFADLYRQAGFGSLRYPGGTISNNYVWTESIGDLDPATPQIERTPQIHGFYNNRGQAGFVPAFGLLEVAEFAERTGSEIIMVYGIGRGDALDAADMVEFLNARQGTNPNGGVAWADKRAELGHPEPFGIRYFEIGNENNQGGDDGTSSQQYWMPQVPGGALEGYVDGGTARFNRQYAVVRGDWNVDTSRSTGKGGQEFACRYALIPRTGEDGAKRDAVVRGSVKVYVDGREWHAVDDLRTAGATDEVYQLDITTGFFTFGDGEHGKIPAAGKQVTVDYQVERDGFIDISKAMRETMAQINAGADPKGEINIYTSWEADNFVDKMHQKSADHLYDGMAVHPYTNKVGNPANNDNTPTVEGKTRWYLDVMRLGDGVANSVRHHVEHMRNVTGDVGKVPVISEYGIFRSVNPLVRSQTHALYVARAIMEYAEQGSPYIQKHCLVDYYSSGADSLGPTQQAVIQAVAQGDLDNQKDGTGPFKFFPTPSAHVFQMLNSSFGTQMIGASLSNERVLSNGVSQHSVMASSGEDGAVHVAIVNLGLNDVDTAGADAGLSQKVTLAVKGVDLTGRELTVKTLAGDTFYQENDLDHPDNVEIVETTMQASAPAQELNLAPHSFTIVTIAPEHAAPAPTPPIPPAPTPPVPTPPAPTPPIPTPPTPPVDPGTSDRPEEAPQVEFVVEGQVFASMSTVGGRLDGAMPLPTRAGWRFAGWFTASGAPFDRNTPIQGDMVLIAKWVKAERPPSSSEGAGPGGVPGYRPGDGLGDSDNTTGNDSGQSLGGTSDRPAAASSHPRAGLPRTGDIAAPLTVGTLIAGVLLVAAGVVWWLRKR